VLFDLDGTLVRLNFDAKKTRKDLHDFYLREYGVDESFLPVLQKIREVEELLKLKRGSEIALDASKSALEILRRNEERALSGSTILSHAKESLEILRESGIKIGIFSRTTKSVVLMALKKHDLGPFDVVITREDTKEAKPSPEPVLQSISILKINPKDCLVIGDHPYDIISGGTAGAITAGILTGIGSRKDLELSGADYIFNDLVEFLESISKII
jgi:phosphoglycolate phosphatase